MSTAEIERLELELIEAIKKSDVNFIDRYLHPDLLFLAPNGQVITKEMDLASHRAKQMVVEHLIPYFEHCEIIGDVAVSVMVYETKGSMLGNPIEGKFRYIRNWKLFLDGLKIISGACVHIG